MIQFKDFMDALNFTSRVGHLAETESHHPAQGCSVLRQCHCEAYFAEAIPTLQAGDCFVPRNDTHKIFRTEQPCHPAILTEWGAVTARWWTHKIHGLHRNDFIMAAKTDQLYAIEN